MRDEFTDSGFFVLRTPLLPIQELLGFSSIGQRGDRIAALRRWTERPEVREALWIASPELLHALGTLWEHPESPKGRRLEQALYRYLARMAGRPTPFGAFAGCSTGAIGDATRLELPPRSSYRLHTRLDMEILCRLAGKLSADPASRRKLPFRTNPSLHAVAGGYHHAQIVLQDGLEVVHLIATEATAALEDTLSRAAGGAKAEDLAAALVAEDPEITQEDTDAFLGQLIQSQLLLPELIPPVTGKEPPLHMTELLEAAQEPELAAELRGTAEELDAFDGQPLGSDGRAYDGIAERVGGWGLDVTPGHLVQVDLMKPAPGLALDRELTRRILDALEALHAIRRDPGAPPLRRFKEQFRDRYQDQEIALLEALDDEAGIGFEQEDNPNAEPLIAGIDFRPSEDAPQMEDGALPPALARRLEEVRAKREAVLELDPDLLRDLETNPTLPLPDAFSVMGAAFRSQGAHGFCLHSAAGPSGANLLTRFCHDSHLAGCLQAHVYAEEALDPGRVFAEIVHLPEGRVGNVVRRPDLRRFEIPLLATPGVPPERQLPLSDLTLSVREDRVVVRSRRLDAEILPRLTCAHNFAGARSWKLYKFLCLLQHQDSCPELYFDWGPAAHDTFLPRVSHGGVVVSLARWRISGDLSADLAEGRMPVHQWRETHGVPRLVFIAEGDNQLLIDFDNPLAVDTFLDLVRKRTETVVVELFPGPEALAARGPEGSFVQEMIIPFVRARPRPAQAQAPESAAPEPSQPPSGPEHGSEWLFAKLYCSPSHADLLLTELVRPLAAEVLRPGAADAWFFMRYADPEWHLRLRFHGAPEALETSVLPALLRWTRPFQQNGVLWRLTFERYEPEVERYGGPEGIGVAERFFEVDSELGLDLMPFLLGEEGPELRWRLALCGADRLLTGLGFGEEAKKVLVERLQASREQAWTVDGSYRQQVAHAFRSVHGRETLAALLDDPGETLPPEALAAFERYSRRLQPLQDAWQGLEQAGRLTAPLPEIAASLVHMHLNRLLRAGHLQQEAVICDFLGRLYATRLARRKQ